jgi:hypothetical protein
MPFYCKRKLCTKEILGRFSERTPEKRVRRETWIRSGRSDSMRSNRFPNYRIAPMIVGRIVLIAGIDSLTRVKVSVSFIVHNPLIRLRGPTSSAPSHLLSKGKIL